MSEIPPKPETKKEGEKPLFPFAKKEPPEKSAKKAESAEKEGQKHHKEDSEKADKTLDVQMHNQEIEQKIKEKTPIKDLSDVAKLSPLDLQKMEKEHRGLLGALFLRKEIENSTEGARTDFFENLSEKNITQTYNYGDKFTVNFCGNLNAEMKVGAGDMLPPHIRLVVFKTPDGQKIVGTRDSSPRPGYYNAEHEYIPVFQDDEISIPTQEEAEDITNEQNMNNWDRVTMFSDNENIPEDKRKNIEQEISDEEKSRDNLIDRYEHEDKYKPLEYDQYDDTYKSGGTDEGMPEDYCAELSTEIPKVREIFEQNDIDEDDQKIIFAIMKAIGEGESGNVKDRYSAEGPMISDPNSPHYGQTAKGKYQIMPAYWPSWCQETFGKVLRPDGMAQEIVTLNKMAQYYARYLHSSRKQYSLDDKVRLVAVNWYGNMGAPKDDVSQISRRKPSVGPSPYAYSLLALTRFKRIYK